MVSDPRKDTDRRSQVREPVQRVELHRSDAAVDLRSARRGVTFDRLWSEIGPAEKQPFNGRRSALDW